MQLCRCQWNTIFQGRNFNHTWIFSSVFSFYFRSLSFVTNWTCGPPYLINFNTFNFMDSFEWVLIIKTSSVLSYEIFHYENLLQNHVPHCKCNKFRPSGNKNVSKQNFLSICAIYLLTVNNSQWLEKQWLKTKIYSTYTVAKFTSGLNYLYLYSQPLQRVCVNLFFQNYCLLCMKKIISVFCCNVETVHIC